MRAESSDIPFGQENAKWGKFKHDEGNLSGAGRYGEQAVTLMKRAGYR